MPAALTPPAKERDAGGLSGSTRVSSLMPERQREADEIRDGRAELI